MGKPDTSAEKKTAAEQTQVAEKQDARADTLFNLGLPGLKTANDHYSKIASGDPTAIFTQVAPAAERIAANRDATKKNIDNSAPRGGTRDLAKQEADIGAAGQIGNLETQAFTGAFPALASIGQGGVGLSINEVASALQGFSGASSTEANVANQQAQGKASMLGFMGSLAGSGATMGAAAMA